MKIKLSLLWIITLFYSIIANSLELNSQINNTCITTEPQATYSTLWGLKGATDLGLGTKYFRPEPIQISEDNWISAAGGYNFSVAIKSDRTLWIWGGAPYMYGPFADLVPIPNQVGNDNDWQCVTVGYYCAYAIKTDGSLWAWGWNEYGTLGDSSTIDTPTPKQIGKDYLGKVKYITASNYTIALITEDGSLWMWGRNTKGQLGDGTNIDKFYPIKIGNTGEWKTVACNSSATFAIKTDGTLWAWGENSYSSFLGDGTTNDQNKPIQIGSDTDWADISTNKVTLALKTDATLWAWGWNYYGGIGDGTLEDVLTPKQIGTENDWLSVESQYMRAIGQKKDSTLWAWGYNLGLNDYNKCDTILIPTKVKNISSVIKILPSIGSLTLFLRNYKAFHGKIETLPITKITYNSAECGGNVTSAGSEEIYQRGVCYGITPNPNLDNGFTENGTSLGEFQSSLTNLQSFRKYYYRAYLRTAAGDAYGEEKSFLTGLAKPILYKPENNEVVDPTKVTFVWNMDINEQGYRIQLSESADFNSFIFDTIVPFPKCVYNDLQLNSKYYWHVQTTNGEYLSDWSEVWSFRTSSTSVSNLSDIIQINPNPAGDFINISLKPSEGFEPSEGSVISIYNTLGEIVTTSSLLRNDTPPKDGNLRINISTLPIGIYFVKVGGETAKFVKM